MAEIEVTRVDPAFDVVGFRLSWGAIWAGFIIATVIQLFLTVLGLAIGLGTWNPGDSFGGYGTGAAIWFVVAGIISLFLGGLATGRLAGILKRSDGILHGIVVWALVALVTAWMVASGVGKVMGGTFSVLSQTVAATAGGIVNSVGSVAGAAINNSGSIDWSALQNDVASILDQTGVPALQPDSLGAAAQRVGNAATSGSESNQALAQDIGSMIRNRAGKVDREAIVNVIVARTNMSRADANRVAMRIDSAANAGQRQLASTLDAAQSRAGNIAENTTNALSTAAWLSLVAMLLSLGAAILGAGMTARS